MRIAVIGAGAVGGYYGAMLTRAGHAVTLVGRGAHLAAIQAHGLTVRASRGEFSVRPGATDTTSEIGPVDLVLVAVKTYDNDTALPMLRPLTAPGTVVLTLQNGVDSPSEVAAVTGETHVLGGAAYIATAVASPGLIEQTGSHHRIVFGEAFSTAISISPRAAALRSALEEAGIEAQAVPDARVPLWEKCVYLVPFAGFTGASRTPIGPLWQHEETRGLFIRACGEVAAVARAEGVDVPADVPVRVRAYADALPPTTRSSLLIDLQQGKRIEVEALQGALVRRARAHAIAVPIMETLYAVLRNHAQGAATT
jgi:2-dehydropantoate 2-reductase